MPLSVEKKHGPFPPRILIMGVPKIGKSTFGASAPNPIFIRTEDGLDTVLDNYPDAMAYPIAKGFEEVMNNLRELATEDHDRKTVVVDSVDWLEPLIFKEVIRDQNKANVKSIEDIGFAKGYIFALTYWQRFIDALNYLRMKKGMTVILISHTVIKTFTSPEHDAYNIHAAKLHEKASAKLEEFSDAILFAHHDVTVTGEGKVVGGRNRILRCTPTPTTKTGSRYDLPDKIIFDKEGAYWGVLAERIPYFKKMLAEQAAAEQSEPEEVLEETSDEAVEEISDNEDHGEASVVDENFLED